LFRREEDTEATIVPLRLAVVREAEEQGRTLAATAPPVLGQRGKGLLVVLGPTRAGRTAGRVEEEEPVQSALLGLAQQAAMVAPELRRL
jgi:hypothetical protein